MSSPIPCDRVVYAIPVITFDRPVHVDMYTMHMHCKVEQHPSIWGTPCAKRCCPY